MFAKGHGTGKKCPTQNRDSLLMLYTAEPQTGQRIYSLSTAFGTNTKEIWDVRRLGRDASTNTILTCAVLNKEGITLPSRTCG